MLLHPKVIYNFRSCKKKKKKRIYKTPDEKLKCKKSLVKTGSLYFNKFSKSLHLINYKT
ncbi:hypothetical protein PGB90_002190 [Kerria lacca]